MNQLAVKISGPDLVLIDNSNTFGATTGALNTTSGYQVVLLGIIMVTIQVLDGVFTAIGVGHFGTSAEGNIIIRTLMDLVGHIEALVLVKTCAIAVTLNLCFLATKVKWLTVALKVVIAIYMFAAIIPWCAIILTRIV